MKSGKNKWVGGTAAGMLLVALAGCGGGGSDGPKPAINSGSATGTPSPGTVVAGSVSLSLADAGGAAGTVLSSGKPLTALATVRDATGAPLVNTLVTFSVDSALALMEPASGTVATDASGQARVTLRPASLASSGSGLLKATATVGSAAIVSQSVISIGANKLSLKLVTPESGAVRLMAYNSALVTVDVLNDGAPMSSESVPLKLSSLCAAAGKATLPDQVLSLNGRAQVVYRDQGCTQSDVITIGAAGIANSLVINVQASAPNAASIQLASVVPSNNAIVIKGAGGSGRTETATVTFKVVDSFGKPLANQAVSFATISTKPVSLGRSTDVTDADGQVSTTVNAGTEPTAVRVQATLANGLTTISDTIAVTTGVPVQSAFSLSTESYNIEGLNFDNMQTSVLALLADQFGNPVADGTPVVFQTDSGAIGSAARGGCTTVNGACSVSLRSQNPRFDTDASAPQGRAGMATIAVSTLSNTSTPITGQLAIFLSGSNAEHISRVLDNGASEPVTGPLSLSTAACGNVALNLRVSDRNFNPMPSRTTISGKTGNLVSIVEVAPSSVPSSAPKQVNGVVRGDQGSTHLIVLQPDLARCAANGTSTSTGSAIVHITTPQGIVTPVTITLKFPSA